MERKTSIENVKKIFGSNFIGPDELYSLSDKFKLNIPQNIPEIPYRIETLKKLKKDYLLILTVSEFSDKQKINILKLREIFGLDPDNSEPCFYNQDWYLKEDFVKKGLELNWVLVKKNVFEDSRAVDPNILSSKMNFPSAIASAYTFFIYRLLTGRILWELDFIWCSDTDHNGDRIYIGKYRDIDGVNKNGFSIHRHLSLRECYASIDII